MWAEKKKHDKDVKDAINGKATHEENSRTAMELASHIWPATDVRHCKDSTHSSLKSGGVDKILAAARASQRKEKRGGPVVKNADEAPALTVEYSATIAEVHAWCEDIGQRKVDKRKVLNDSQFRVVTKVVERVCEEMEDMITGTTNNNREPLRWAMHGGPGTGKTHVIKNIKEELFEKVLKWNTSVEFQIVAMQAVMADLLEGDTIHHAFNIPVYGRNFSARPPQQGSKKDIDFAKTVLQYRWLIIDEISMVSASLLAEIDMKLRSLARDVDPYCKNTKGALRPFAGVNVLCSGDFWQITLPARHPSMMVCDPSDVLSKYLKISGGSFSFDVLAAAAGA